MKAEFYILGVLHRGDFHPYEIKRRLNNALVECYTDVDVGTLYYAVRQLVKSGDIAPKTKQKVARGGERTIYRITSQGRSAFRSFCSSAFRNKEPWPKPFIPLCSFSISPSCQLLPSYCVSVCAKPNQRWQRPVRLKSSSARVSGAAIPI